MFAPLKRPMATAGWLAWMVAFGSAVLCSGQEPKPAPLPPGLIRGPSPGILDLVSKGREVRNAGKRGESLAMFEDALQKARAKGDKSGEAWAMNNIATAWRYEGTDQQAAEALQKATELYERALAFSREIADTHNEAYATLYLGVLAEERGGLDQAFRRYESALKLFTAVEDPYYLARTYTFLGKATLHKRQQPEAALEFFEKALPNFRAVRAWKEAADAIREMYTAYERLSRNAGGKSP